MALCKHDRGIDEHPYCPRDGRYRQIQFRGLAGAMRAHDPNHAVLSLVVKQGDVPYAKGIVGKGGWTYPFRLEMW